MIVALLASVLVYTGAVDHVVDGDTVSVTIASWPAPFRPIGIRIKGIDTPEHVMPPAKAPCEVALGVSASDFAKTLAKKGDKITISWRRGDHDKYDRLLASVKLADGRDWATTMIAGKYAVAYAGGTKQPWC